jgi:hypothetical protein
MRRRPRRAKTVSATYLFLAIKTAGAENVAALAAGTAFARECSDEADRCSDRPTVAAAWEQLSHARAETVRTLLAGLGVIVVAPRHGHA